MNSIPKLQKSSCGKIYKYLSSCDNHNYLYEELQDSQAVFSGATFVEFDEEISKNELQGCLEAWMEGLKNGYYRINLL